MRAVVTVALVMGCSPNPSRLDPAPPVGSPPFAGMPLAIDGLWTEPAWNLRAQRGALGDGGSEIRLLRDERELFVGLDALDRDVANADAFELVIGAVTIAIGPAPDRAKLAGIRVATKIAGTIEQPGDEDAGWRVELAIPIAALGPPPVAIRATRCDTRSVTARDSERTPACGQWSATLEPTLPPEPTK